MRIEKREGIDGIWLDDLEWNDLVTLEAMIRADEAEAEAARLSNQVASLRKSNAELEERLARERWDYYRREQELQWAAQPIGVDNPWRYGGPMHHRMASYYMMAWQASRMAQMGISPNPVQQAAMNAFRM